MFTCPSPYIDAFPLLQPARAKLSPDGKRLVIISSCPGPAAALFAFPSLRLLATCPIKAREGRDVCFHPTKPLIFIAHGEYDGGWSWSGNLIVWNTQSGKAWEHFDTNCPAVLKCEWDSSCENVLRLDFSPPDDMQSFGTQARFECDWASQPDAPVSSRSVPGTEFVFEQYEESTETLDVEMLSKDANREYEVVVANQPHDTGIYQQEETLADGRNEPAYDVTDDRAFVENVVVQSVQRPVVALFGREGCWACGPAAVLLKRDVSRNRRPWAVVSIDGTQTPRAAELVCLTGYPLAAVFHHGQIVSQHFFPTPGSIEGAVDWSRAQERATADAVEKRVERLRCQLIDGRPTSSSQLFWRFFRTGSWRAGA
jgi:hypothetical protein